MTVKGKNNPNWKGGVSKNKKEYQRKWFQDNKEKMRERSRLWYRDNKEKGQAINLKSHRKIRLLTLQAYSDKIPKCACCGEKEIKFLGIDHINNDGAADRKRIGRGGGASFYYYLKKNGFPKGYQVLCHNCNFAKGLYGRCPHEDI